MIRQRGNWVLRHSSVKASQKCRFSTSRWANKAVTDRSSISTDIVQRLFFAVKHIYIIALILITFASSVFAISVFTLCDKSCIDPLPLFSNLWRNKTAEIFIVIKRTAPLLLLKMIARKRLAQHYPTRYRFAQEEPLRDHQGGWYINDKSHHTNHDYGCCLTEAWAMPLMVPVRMPEPLTAIHGQSQLHTGCT